MYDIGDTIAAISSAAAVNGKPGRSIIRVSGSQAFASVNDSLDVNLRRSSSQIESMTLDIDGIDVETIVYSFLSPRSYTGEDMIELHVLAAACVVEIIFAKIVSNTRTAGPGEFTLRAYLNGRIDLSQAEAVGQIVSGSNRLQIAAAEKLLQGKVTDKINSISDGLLDILSLIEAGMDFSEEDIEFISAEQSYDRIGKLQDNLQELLDKSIRYEAMLDLPSVALVGASNAGKSSLLNILLGDERSIVSDTIATTRDILTGVIELKSGRCVLFDCAGLSIEDQTDDTLDRLAQEAAIEAITGCDLAVLCVDITGEDFSHDRAVLEIAQTQKHLLVATKCDKLEADSLTRQLEMLAKTFDDKPIATSAITPSGIDELLSGINARIESMKGSATEADQAVALNVRHRKVVSQAIENLSQASEQTRQGNNEIVAMLLRNAYDVLSFIGSEDVDEAVLTRIFSKFCIGK